jgi:hypothetical protein
MITLTFKTTVTGHSPCSILPQLEQRLLALLAFPSPINSHPSTSFTTTSTRQVQDRLRIKKLTDTTLPA